ncbi:hypothetical protein V2J09_008518 [Rumex salicifolius]
MGVIIEQRQPTAVAGIDDFGGGGDKDKKKRRPRRKQNSPPAGPSFNPGKQGEATKCSQSSSCTGSPSVRQHMLKESDVAYLSMPTLHLGEQGMKHNLDAKANFKSCPTQVALKESVRSSLDVNFLPPFTEGCQQSCFEPHWSLEDVNEALSVSMNHYRSAVDWKGEVFEATFRVNAHNRLEAYCTIDGVTTDVLLSGIPVQNRAIDGDIVALIVDPPMYWARMKGSNGYANNPGISGDPLLPEKEPDNISDINSCIVTSGVGDEGSSSDQNDEATYAVEKLCEAVSAFSSKRPTGRVVAIIEPSARRNTIVGFLNIKQWLSSRENCGKSNRKKKNMVTEYIQFSPTNPKFPKMVVPVQGLPDSVKKRLNDGDMSIEMELVSATISEWGEKYPLPQACVLQTFGRAGEIQPHIAAILFENDICCLEFSSESLTCLPHNSWEVPETELINRRDIRNLCVFTIDPSTATDLDDALSFERLSSDVNRVGVHIADVSYFVQPDTALDMEAQVRSSSVYMLQRKLPMLPPKLSENLGSLIPGVDRLAFSIFWDFDMSGNIIDRWIGRTVIHSCCKLSYDHAEDILEGRQISDRNIYPEQDGLPQLHGHFEWKDVISSVKNLHEISKLLKDKRFIDGALVLENSKLSFVLDEYGVPYDSKLSDRKDSNFLVEEFMLLANRTAAEIISHAYPESALLRRHPEPNMRKLRELETFCIKHGLELDASSSRSFRSSLEKIRDKLKDDSVLYDVLISNATKPMQLAKYFCTGDVKVSQNEWGHYALAVPCYTHFTSPLRRYPDIVVHRTLSAALEAEHMYVKHQKLLGKANNQDETNRCFTGINFNKVAAESDEGKKALSAAALRNRIPCTEVLLDVAEHCNKRKLACKNVKEAVDRLYMWVLIKNKQVLLSEARVLGLGPKFMSIYVPALTTEKRIYYDEIEGLVSEWFEATSTLVLSLWLGSKRFHRKGSPGKCKALEDVALIVNPLELNPETDSCPISQSEEDSITKPEVDPVVLPLTVRLLSTIPVALHAVGGDDGPLDISARLYISSYYA